MGLNFPTWLEIGCTRSSEKVLRQLEKRTQVKQGLLGDSLEEGFADFDNQVQCWGHKEGKQFEENQNRNGNKLGKVDIKACILKAARKKMSKDEFLINKTEMGFFHLAK